MFHLKYLTNRRWKEAHPGDERFHADVPKAVRDRVDTERRDLVARFGEDGSRAGEEPASSFYWTLNDPEHVDISRAIALLEVIREPAVLTGWTRS